MNKTSQWIREGQDVRKIEHTKSLETILMIFTIYIKDYYGHIWQTSNSAAELSFTYMTNMYMPTHTRFGPFAVGAVLACNVALSWYSLS